MNGQFTRFPGDLTDTIQMNAGILVDDFTPATGEVGSLLGATGSGVTFQPNPAYEDLGADIDNVPPNAMQLKRVKHYDPALSGSFRTMTAALAAKLSGAGDFAEGSAVRYIPSHQLKSSDFQDVWIIGDYSAHNAGAQTAGYIAIHLKHALNETGFRWKSNKDGKGEFDFDFHAHYDLNHPDDAPFEIYVKSGTA